MVEGELVALGVSYSTGGCNHVMMVHMLTRITLTLDPVDVALIDRLAALQDLNRSEQIRQFLGQARPMIRQTVEVLEAALRSRDEFLDVWSQAELTGLQDLMPEVEKVQSSVIGSLSRLEGGLAAQAALDPRPSNHGGHTSNPPPEKTPE